MFLFYQISHEWKTDLSKLPQYFHVISIDELVLHTFTKSHGESMTDSWHLGLNHRQQQIQSLMQEQIPQQIQQTQETIRERTRDTKIIHIHHTGRHSPESKEMK